jgi:hypothetical protein
MSKRSAKPSWAAERLPAELLESKLFVFNVKLPNGGVVRLNILDDVELDFDLLEQHLQQASGQYVFWAAIYSELRTGIAVREMQIKKCKATLMAAAAQRNAGEQRQKRLTDKQLAAIVDGDPKLIRLEADLALAHRDVGKVFHALEGVRMRAESARSLAGFKRQEREQSARQT